MKVLRNPELWAEILRKKRFCLIRCKADALGRTKLLEGWDLGRFEE